MCCVLNVAWLVYLFQLQGFFGREPLLCSMGLPACQLCPWSRRAAPTSRGVLGGAWSLAQLRYHGTRDRFPGILPGRSMLRDRIHVLLATLDRHGDAGIVVA